MDWSPDGRKGAVAELGADEGGATGSNPYGLPMKDRAWRAVALPAASAESAAKEEGPG